MPAKKAGTSPVRDLAKLFDGSVAEWNVIVATILKYRKVSLGRVEAALKKLVEAASSSATAEVDAAEAQRVVGTRLAEHAQLVTVVLEVLDGKVPTLVPSAQTQASADIQGGDPYKYLVQIAEEALKWVVDDVHPLDVPALVRHVIEAIGDPGSESGAKRSARFWKECVLRILSFRDEADAVAHGIKASPRGGVDMGSLQAALEEHIAKLKKAQPATPAPANGDAAKIWDDVAEKLGQTSLKGRQAVLDHLNKVAILHLAIKSKTGAKDDLEALQLALESVEAE